MRKIFKKKDIQRIVDKEIKYIRSKEINEIKKYLKKIENKLVEWGKDKNKIKDNAHREMITKYIGESKIRPLIPKTFKGFMQQFMMSAFSYNVLRKDLTRKNGGQTPRKEDIPSLWKKLFGRDDFSDGKIWEQKKIEDIAFTLAKNHLKKIPKEWKDAFDEDFNEWDIKELTNKEQVIKCYTDFLKKYNRDQKKNKTPVEQDEIKEGRKEFRKEIKFLELRIIFYMLTAPSIIHNEIGTTKKEIDQFKRKIWSLDDDPFKRWDYAKSMFEEVPNVRTALTCDFLKESGFTKFIKLDVHMLEQLPKLMGRNSPDIYKERMKGYGFENPSSDKYQKFLFALTPKICELLNKDKAKLEPFHLDKLLYVWGWAKSAKNKDKVNLTDADFEL